MCTNTTATLGTSTAIIHPRSSSSSSSLMNGNGGGGGGTVSGVNAGIVEPFPFSTFHFLRTCNRLLIPTTDLIPYYNFTKDPEKIMDCLSNDNKMITSTNTNNSSHSNRHHHHHHQHHHQHQHHQKSDLYSSINDIFPISVTATSTPTPAISKTALNKQNNTMNITSEQQLPSILSASTSTLLPHLSALDYHPLQLQPPPSSPTNISSNDNTSSMEYPLGPHNRISELNYSNLMNRRQRGEKRPIPDEQKDEKYYERRKRNNEAAKKSRDARKLREDRIAFRAAILEQENAILRAQLIALREEISTMRQIIGTRPAQISVNL